MLSDLPGVLVGHWTDPVGRTGCTVIRFPEGTVASGEVRGGAPATREFALLDPSTLVSRIDAVVLSGGSAFGLSAGDGVAKELAQQGIGFETAGGPVPIVVGMSLYDLMVGDATAHPDAAAGIAALAAVTSSPLTGRVGAGTGATVSKWRGAAEVVDAGLAIEVVVDGDLVVGAIVATNAAGDIGRGTVRADLGAGRSVWPTEATGLGTRGAGDSAGMNTIIGVVVTNAALDPTACHVVAQGAHDGLARAVTPPHMRTDGDAFVAASVGSVDAAVDHVRLLAVHTVETAITASIATLEG